GSTGPAGDEDVHLVVHPEVLAEEAQNAAPRVFCGGRVVGRPPLAEERVAGVGVHLDVVTDAVAREGRIYSSTRGRSEVAARVGTDDRTGAPDDVQGTRVGGVKGSDRLEAGVRACPRDGEASAHAEADRAEPLRVDLGTLGQVGERVLEAGHAVAVPGAQ